MRYNKLKVSIYLWRDYIVEEGTLLNEESITGMFSNLWSDLLSFDVLLYNLAYLNAYKYERVLKGIAKWNYLWLLVEVLMSI